MDSERKPSKSRDVFGDYLQSISSVKTGVPQPEPEASEAQAEADAAVESRPQEGSLGLIPVLTYLKEHNDQSLPELAAGLGSPILQTADVINKLAASGVLELHGDPGNERVRLTEAGVNLSSVA